MVGHTLFSPITIEAEAGAVDSLALAPMAVSPEFQKQGIGSAMIKAGIRRCQELGYESVVVLGHDTYYPRFGFEIASEKGIRAPFEVSSEAFMVLELVGDSLKGIQGTVKYSEPFSL